MKRKTKKDLTPCEEKALVHLQALQIKEKEQKAKARAKKRKLDSVGTSVGTLTGQNLPYAPITETPSQNIPLSYFPRETAMPTRNEWNQLIPAAMQTAQLMILNHAMNKQGQWRQPQQTEQRQPVIVPPRIPPNQRPLIELMPGIGRPVGPIQPRSDVATTAMNALRQVGSGISSVSTGIANIAGRVATGVGGLMDSAKKSMELSRQNKIAQKNIEIELQNLQSAENIEFMDEGLSNLTEGPNSMLSPLNQMLNKPGPDAPKTDENEPARKRLRRELEKSRMERQDVNAAPQRAEEDIIEEPRVQEDIIVPSNDLTQPAHTFTTSADLAMRLNQRKNERQKIELLNSQSQQAAKNADEALAKQEEQENLLLNRQNVRFGANATYPVTPRGAKRDVLVNAIQAGGTPNLFTADEFKEVQEFDERKEQEAMNRYVTPLRSSQEEKKQEVSAVRQFSLPEDDEKQSVQATATSLGSIGGKSPAAKVSLRNADGSVVVTKAVRSGNISNSMNVVKWSVANRNGEEELKKIYNIHANDPNLKKTLRVPRLGEIPYVKIDNDYMLNQNGKVVSRSDPRQLHPSYELESNPGAVRAISTRITHNDVVNYLSDPENVSQAKRFYEYHNTTGGTNPLQVTPAHQLTSEGILKPVQTNIPYDPEEDTLFDDIQEDYGPGAEMEMTNVRMPMIE
jgi:hypothetical protein